MDIHGIVVSAIYLAALSLLSDAHWLFTGLLVTGIGTTEGQARAASVSTNAKGTSS